MSSASSKLGSISVGVSSQMQSQSKFEVAPGRNVHIDLPVQFSTDHIALALRDTEIIQAILKNKPKEMEAIMSSVTTGNFKEAQKLAEEIGLSEDYFIKQGGGMWALVILIAVGCALLLAHD
jgi:hypothetical protein